MYGGVTTPDELRRIADVADKYEVPMVKVTGGQRIDLLGVRKQDLPDDLARARDAVGPRLREGGAHRQDVRRHRLLPLRPRRLDRPRHRDGEGLGGAVHAGQGQGRRLRAARATAPRRPSRTSASSPSRAAGRSASAARPAATSARPTSSPRSRPVPRRCGSARSSSSTTARTPTTWSARTTSCRGSASSGSARSSSTRPSRRACCERFRIAKAAVDGPVARARRPVPPAPVHRPRRRRRGRRRRPARRSRPMSLLDACHIDDVPIGEGRAVTLDGPPGRPLPHRDRLVRARPRLPAPRRAAGRRPRRRLLRDLPAARAALRPRNGRRALHRATPWPSTASRSAASACSSRSARSPRPRPRLPPSAA